MRLHLTNELFSVESNGNSIIQLFSDSEVKNWTTTHLTFPLSPKVKEVHFKILSNIFPSRDLLRQRFSLDNNNCTFCDNDIETTDHLFFYCVYSGTFQEDLQDWISTRIFLIHPLTREDIIFGTTLKDNISDFVFNYLLILAKFFYLFIHANGETENPIFLAFTCFTCF